MSKVEVKKRRPFARGRAVRRLPGEMNKTEERYATDLAARTDINYVWFDEWTFKLAKDTRYTPDFIVLLSDGTLEAHEVKGFMEDDAWVKLKVFAEKFPLRTFLAKAKAKRDGGGWDIKEVGPKE